MSNCSTDVSRRRTFTSIAGHTFYPAGLSAQPVVVDFGANHGRFSQLVSQEFKAAQCYLVEANPDLVSELRGSQAFPVLHCAVADHDGQVTFNLAWNDQGSSVLDLRDASTTGPGCGLSRQILAPARTLPGILEELPHSYFDLVKIDIEGAEILAFPSCSRDLMSRIGQITIEFHSHPMFGFEIGRQVNEIVTKMRQEGFIVLDFTFGAMVDVLMINKRRCGINSRQEWFWRTSLAVPCWLRPAGALAPRSLRRRIAGLVKPSTNDLG